MDTRTEGGTGIGRVGAFLRRERGLTALAGMAVLGLGVSIYLTAVHYAGVPLVCPANTLINCARVTTSPYSVVPGTHIPITIPGMLWFVASGALAVVALARVWNARPEPARLRLAHLLLGAAGLLFVLYLVYCEIVLLRQICEWCTVVHLLTLATFLVALSRWQRAASPAPQAQPSVRRIERPTRAPASTQNGAPRASTSARRHPATSATSRNRGRRR